MSDAMSDPQTINDDDAFNLEEAVRAFGLGHRVYRRDALATGDVVPLQTVRKIEAAAETAPSRYGDRPFAVPGLDPSQVGRK